MQIQALLVASLAVAADAAFIKLPRASNSTSASASVAGADFGSCTPTMDFQLGRAQFSTCLP